MKIGSVHEIFGNPIVVWHKFICCVGKIHLIQNKTTGLFGSHCAEQQFNLHLSLAIQLANQLGTLVHTWHVSTHGGFSKLSKLSKHTGLNGAGVQHDPTRAGLAHGSGTGTAFEHTTGAGVHVGAGAGSDLHTTGAGSTNFCAHEQGFFGIIFDLHPQPPTANAYLKEEIVLFFCSNFQLVLSLCEGILTSTANATLKRRITTEVFMADLIVLSSDE